MAMETYQTTKPFDYLVFSVLKPPFYTAERFTVRHTAHAPLIGFYCLCYFIFNGNIELYHANQLSLSSVGSSIISSGDFFFSAMSSTRKGPQLIQIVQVHSTWYHCNDEATLMVQH